MKDIKKSKKMQDICYDIRGPILDTAKQMEDAGQQIIKLNIGNPAPFELFPPEEITKDLIRLIPDAGGYSDSQGLFSARKAIMQYYQKKGLLDIDIEDIFLGNGVSELILMSVQALLNVGDEILIPSPDYPLWTAAGNLSGAKVVHYKCDEDNGWQPDLEDIQSKTNSNTRAIVLINPNNPTGAVYSEDLVKKIVAFAESKGLVIFSDEIYEKIRYDNVPYTSIASLKPNTLVLTFNGLSKTYRVAGYRSGWMLISGRKDQAKDYIEGLHIMANVRLCPNVPGQMAIQTALGGYQSIDELIKPGGRLYEQRNYAYEFLNSIEGVSCVKPDGALYLFPKIDPKVFKFKDDKSLVLEILKQEQVLVVQGTGFNLETADHFRVVFLPKMDMLKEALNRIKRYLDSIRA